MAPWLRPAKARRTAATRATDIKVLVSQAVLSSLCSLQLALSTVVGNKKVTKGVQRTDWQKTVQLTLTKDCPTHCVRVRPHLLAHSSWAWEQPKQKTVQLTPWESNSTSLQLKQKTVQLTPWESNSLRESPTPPPYNRNKTVQLTTWESSSTSLQQRQKTVQLTTWESSSTSLQQRQKTVQLTTWESSSTSLQQRQKTVQLTTWESSSTSLQQRQKTVQLTTWESSSTSLQQRQKTVQLTTWESSSTSLQQRQKTVQLTTWESSSTSLQQRQKTVQLTTWESSSTFLFTQRSLPHPVWDCVPVLGCSARETTPILRLWSLGGRLHEEMSGLQVKAVYQHYNFFGLNYLWVSS